jgi:hypothetical protein
LNSVSNFKLGYSLILSSHFNYYNGNFR